MNYKKIFLVVVVLLIIAAIVYYFIQKGKRDKENNVIIEEIKHIGNNGTPPPIDNSIKIGDLIYAKYSIGATILDTHNNLATYAQIAKDAYVGQVKGTYENNENYFEIIKSPRTTGLIVTKQSARK